MRRKLDQRPMTGRMICAASDPFVQAAASCGAAARACPAGGGPVSFTSRWGTFINGVKVQPGLELQISEGDLIRITPWTFSVSAPPASTRGEDSVDDTSTMHTLVRAVSPEQARPLADDMLTLLLESAS